jgi:hypothetical protein
MTTFYVSDSRLPHPQGPGPVFISQTNRVARLYPQALGSLVVASYNSQGYGGGIRPRLHMQFNSTLAVQIITSRHGPYRKHCSSVAVQLLPGSCFIHVCWQSCYLEIAVVQLLISRSSPSHGSICHNMKVCIRQFHIEYYFINFIFKVDVQVISCESLIHIWLWSIRASLTF